jgi:hypothetical protein
LGSVNAGVGPRSSCSFVLAGSSLVVALIFFLSFLLSSSFGWSGVFGDVTSGFVGISLPEDRVALGSVNAGVVRL